MSARDPQTEWMRIQAYRRMGGERRIEIAAEIFEDGIAIVRDSILDRHPNISDDELVRRVRRRVLPRELALQVEHYLRSREAQEKGQ